MDSGAIGWLAAPDWLTPLHRFQPGVSTFLGTMISLHLSTYFLTFGTTVYGVLSYYL